MGSANQGDGIVQPCEVVGTPYNFLGWAITNAMSQGVEVMNMGGANMQMMMDPISANIDALAEVWSDDPSVVHADWELAMPLAGQATAYRFREGIERFLITDINNAAQQAQGQSTLAVMWDSIMDDPVHFNHVPGGTNVLYMDGHVGYTRYAELGEFPANGAGINVHHGMHRNTAGGMTMGM